MAAQLEGSEVVAQILTFYLFAVPGLPCYAALMLRDPTLNGDWVREDLGRMRPLV